MNEEFTPDELKREYDYRRSEAEGLGRNPERAQREADEWLAKINEKSFDNFSATAKRDETK